VTQPSNPETIMHTTFTRPDVADLIFRVFGRAIHPELMEVRDEIVVAENPFVCRLRLHDAGHLLEFRLGEIVLTELVCSREHPLPKAQMCVDHRLRGSRETKCRFRGEVEYQSCLQLEELDAEIFQNFHQELRSDFKRASLCREFSGSSRLAAPALSVIRAEAGRGSFLIHAFHTFPDNFAVVKTQTLIEFAE
jgi:hypothetical protein